LLMGLHGSIFYSGMRRWVYNQAVHSDSTLAYEPEVIRNQVRSYLQASLNLEQALDSQSNPLKDALPWH